MALRITDVFVRSFKLNEKMRWIIIIIGIGTIKYLSHFKSNA